MEDRHPSVREVVDFGLDQIDPHRSVTVPIQDLVRVFKIFEQLNAFFHQPTHYPNMEELAAFLANREDGGAYGLISEAYYDILPRFLPHDILHAHRRRHFRASPTTAVPRPVTEFL